MQKLNKVILSLSIANLFICKTYKRDLQAHAGSIISNDNIYIANEFLINETVEYKSLADRMDLDYPLIIKENNHDFDFSLISEQRVNTENCPIDFEDEFAIGYDNLEHNEQTPINLDDSLDFKFF